MTEAYAEWVLAPPRGDGVATSSYVVCGVQRSGTWLVCGLLHGTGVAGRPHEWFSPATEESLRRAWGMTTFASYVDAVLATGTTPNGVFGAKLMWNDLGGLGARLAAPLEEAFPRARFVWLRREDKLAQAVSWAKAASSGRFHHWDGGRAPPRFDRAFVDRLLRLVREHDDGWRRWFDARGIAPLEVRYEALAADPVAETRSVLQFLDLPDDAPIVVRTVRQADAVNREWIARYSADTRGDDSSMSDSEETTTPPATEGDRDWRERTQDQDPPPDAVQPPPPQDEDVQDDRNLP